MSGHGGSLVINLDVRFKQNRNLRSVQEIGCLNIVRTKTKLRMKKLPNKYSAELAIRVDESNPNHHIWNNNGTWWLHYTVYPTPVTSERRRLSLHTSCLDQARQRRDLLLRKFAKVELLQAA